MREGEDVVQALQRISRKETMWDEDCYDTIEKAIEEIEVMRKFFGVELEEKDSTGMSPQLLTEGLAENSL